MVARPGCTQPQVDRELAELVDYVDRTWSTHFPRREGYLTIVEQLEGRQRGVRIRVLRGDFRSEAEIYCDQRGARGGVERSLMFSARAASDRMASADALAARQASTLAAVGTGLGLVAFGALVAAGLGAVVQPLLAVMALFVLAVVLPAGGLHVGAWIAECIGTARRAGAIAEAATDGAFQRDLRKWRAAVRQLKTRRRALCEGPRGLPFRRERLEPA